MNNSLRKRLAALRAQAMKEPCYCMVRLPDGTEIETTIEEWYAHSAEWRWLRITRGNNSGAILLILAAIDTEVAASATERGDAEAAEALTREAAKFLDQYEEMTR